MTTSGGWRAGLDAVDVALIDGYQSGFPVVRHPFRAVGEELGIDEAAAVERVRRLRDRGVLRRFGAVLNPPVIGSSTLAALRVPPERFDDAAAVVNGHRQVNHNYRRDHEWNMWFVVTAGSLARRDEILAEIEEQTGCPLLNLPMRVDYYIDLEFPVVNGDLLARDCASSSAGDDASSTPAGDAALATPDVEPTRIDPTASTALTALEADLLLAIQDGFPLSPTPYADVAERLEADVEAVLATTERLLARGQIKRVGCVVNHVAVGFDSNCMVVWDVPDDALDERAVAAGSLPYVTLCYHRPRRPDQGWPYNLFTMVHGRETDAVDAAVDELASEYLPVPCERLYSTETLKQTGARYDDLLCGEGSGAD